MVWLEVLKPQLLSNPTPGLGGRRRKGGGLWMEDEVLQQSSTGAEEGGKTAHRVLYMNMPKRR